MDERDSTIENILMEIHPPTFSRATHTAAVPFSLRRSDQHEVLRTLQDSSDQSETHYSRSSLFSSLHPDETAHPHVPARDTLRRGSEIQTLRLHISKLSEENLTLHETVDALRNKCLMYEQEMEQGNAERSSLLDYLSHFRSEHQKVEAKLELYTERMKKLEQTNTALEQRLKEHSPKELEKQLSAVKVELQAKDQENERLISKLQHYLQFSEETQVTFEKKLSVLENQLRKSGNGLAQLDLNTIGEPPESTRRGDRAASARSCSAKNFAMHSPKNRKKTPVPSKRRKAPPSTKENTTRLRRSETPRCGQLPRSGSTRKGLCGCE